MKSVRHKVIAQALLVTVVLGAFALALGQADSSFLMKIAPPKVEAASVSSDRGKSVSPEQMTNPKSISVSTDIRFLTALGAKEKENPALLDNPATDSAQTPASSSSSLSESAKLLHIFEVEGSAIGGTIMGVGLSAGLWTIIQRFLPSGFSRFILGKSRKNDERKEEFRK